MYYKIYVHHSYSYERFWYFFHGVDVNIDDIILYTNKKNEFNKKLLIEDEVNISFKYKEHNFDISFVGSNKWRNEGHHLFDYSMFLYDTNQASDRGFNSNIMEQIDDEIIPFLNKVSSKKDVKYHFFYIDWEGHNSYKHHKLGSTLNKNINFYTDEVPILYSYKNSFYLFTNTFMSFIYPNTLGLREFYFFKDVLRSKDDYKVKINFPIRRLYGSKLKLAKKILKTKNIKVSHSSFHDTNHYNMGDKNTLNFIKKNTSEGNYFIDKRGYGIHDWGGEWNDNNIKEMMWKLFGLSEVNIIPEYHYLETYNNAKQNDIVEEMGTHCITEKSVSHILSGKPIIPIYYQTVEFYENILNNNNISYRKFPLTYNKLEERIFDLDKIADNEVEWKLFVQNLQNWVDDIRDGVISIVNSKNDFLEVIIKEKKEVKIQKLI